MKVKSRRTHLADAAHHVQNAERSLKRAHDGDPVDGPDQPLDLPLVELRRALRKVRWRLQRWQGRARS